MIFIKNTISIYPNGIDDLIFFSDIDLDHLNIMNEFQELISNKKYSKASQLLNSSNVSFYGAWLLNLLENRIYNLQNHLLTKERKEIMLYQENEPTNNLTLNTVWIEKEEV